MPLAIVPPHRAAQENGTGMQHRRPERKRLRPWPIQTEMNTMIFSWLVALAAVLASGFEGQTTRWEAEERVVRPAADIHCKQSMLLAGN